MQALHRPIRLLWPASCRCGCALGLLLVRRLAPVCICGAMMLPPGFGVTALNHPVLSSWASSSCSGSRAIARLRNLGRCCLVSLCEAQQVWVDGLIVLLQQRYYRWRQAGKVAGEERQHVALGLKPACKRPRVWQQELLERAARVDTAAEVAREDRNRFRMGAGTTSTCTSSNALVVSRSHNPDAMPCSQQSKASPGVAPVLPALWMYVSRLEGKS